MQSVPPTHVLTKDTIGHVAHAKKMPVPQPELQYNPQLKAEVTRFIASDVKTLRDIDVNSFRYMYDPPENKRDVLNARVWKVGGRIRAHYKLPEFSKLTEVSQDDRVYLGIVQSCGQVGSAVTCIVDGPWTPDVSYGANIQLQMDDVASYSLYPGKIFAFKGKNVGAHTLDNGTNGTVLVSEVYDAPPLPLAAATHQRVKMEEDAAAPTRVVVMAGPYATDQARTIKQIEDLVKFAYRSRHAAVVVLAGPFVSAPHDGAVDEAMMYDDQFDAITEKISQLAEEYHGLKVLVVPSLKDLAADYVFPQPAFDVAFDSDNVLGLSNPTEVLVNDDVTVAVCTNDIIKHINGSSFVEVRPDPATGRLPRVAAEVVRSQSFYPLMPPAPDAQVDYAHHEAFEFAKSTPDILILPSYLPAFAKKVEGTLVINPGIVNKRNFAEVTITPGAPNALVADRATAEIFKLT